VLLRNSSVWTYDLPANTWTNMRPVPEPDLKPLRGAAYDPDHEVVVIHGGEGAKHNTLAYDLYTNTWHWLKPKNAPPENLSQPGFAYDAVNRVFVLFGSQFKSYAETWIFDLPKNEWKVLKTNATPPFEESSPVLAADTRNGIVLCSVRGKEGLETWALNVANAEWKKLDVPWQGEGQDKSMNGNRNRVLLYLPDRNLFVQEIRTNKEQQIWTFRYAEAPEPLLRPKTVSAVVDTDLKTTVLFLQDPPGKGWTSNIYKGMGTKAWDIQWQLLEKHHKDGMYIDRENVKKGAMAAWYRVHFVTPEGKEALGFKLVPTQPQVVQNLAVSVLGPKKTQLKWQPASSGVSGYEIERAVVVVYGTGQVKSIAQRLNPTSDLAAGAIKQIGPFERLASISGNEYIDTTADLEKGPPKSVNNPLLNKELRPDQLEPGGKPYKFTVYAYRVRPLNNVGTVGGPSPAVLTIPSSPQHVFAKEEGKTATALKWAANPEKGLKGYLVYRHEGRFSNSKIVRLTPEPIKETTFLDKDAGSNTKRYEIVAVDALGQEGIPSQPVWSRREWQSFYGPYAKEWHQ
jgi:hypothetical protein